MLSGKTIVITGAGGTLGRAAVTAVEAQGGQAILIDRSFREDDPDRVRFELDLTDRKAVEEALRHAGPFDGVFNIAGGFAMGKGIGDDGEESDWQNMMRLNVDTCRSMMAAALPTLLARKGAMVNVGAYAALSGKPQMGAYVASKAVVMRLTETLAEEVKARGVRINAVLPTILDTPANREAMPDADRSAWTPPERIAAVLHWLASDAAAAVRGGVVPV